MEQFSALLLRVLGLTGSDTRLVSSDPEEQTAKLRSAAERDGMSMHAAVLKAVDDYLDRRTARRDEMLGRIVKEHDGLLRRLSDA